MAVFMSKTYHLQCIVGIVWFSGFEGLYGSECSCVVLCWHLVWQACFVLEVDYS